MSDGYVYKYGARPAGDDVRAQMAMAVELYNNLVDAENERRMTAWNGPKAPYPPKHVCPKSPAVKAQRRKEREEKARLEAERAAKAGKKIKPKKPKKEKEPPCPVCSKHYAEVRKTVYLQPFVDPKPIYHAMRKRGLFWGTCSITVEAWDAARKATKLHKKVRRRTPEDGSAIAVQIQKPQEGDHDRQFLVEKMPDPRTGRRAQGKGCGRHTVKLRIATVNREPVFCEPIRFEMHRPLAGVISWVKVRYHCVADREVWSVAFTRVEPPGHPTQATEGIVAVDASWRRMPDGSLRIGYAQDTAGFVDELRLPPEWVERGNRADRIQRHRDQYLNELKKSDSRFAHTKSCLGVHRKKEELQINEPELNKWLERDLHLWRYERGCLRSSTLGRRAKMEEWTRMLRGRFAHVVVKDTQFDELKMENDLHQGARRQGHRGAPGETIERLRGLYGMTGMHVVEAAGTSYTCVDCGSYMEVSHHRILCCEQCGSERDCDDVSTRNALRLHDAGKSRPPTARKTTSKFSKRHKKKT